MVPRCVLRSAPSYLCDLCWPVSLFQARRGLRSAARGELWSLGHVKLLCSEGPFRSRVHQPGMIFPLSCDPFRWPTHPNFTSLSSPSLSVTGLGALLSSSLFKRRYISLHNDRVNE